MFSKERFPNASLVLLALILPVGITTALIGGCPQDGGDPNDPNDPNNMTPKVGNSGLTGKYIGSERCATCHNNIHNDWANTLHSQAYEALEKIGQEKNAECVSCHTVGYGDTGGWVDRATTNDLAGVGCEACHGPAQEHAMNVSDKSLRPTINISASVCGKCHTGDHQPNFDDWQVSRHAVSIEPSHATAWAAGTANNLTVCGKCHSGDYFYRSIIKGEVIGDDYLKGKTLDQMNPVTCAICHNPHAKTGNASTPEEGRDYQLRFLEVKYPTPTNTLEAAQDPTRFNICGQCHHARDRVWTDSSREPHPSDQSNVFFGEMPLPPSKPDPIVPSRPSVHLNAPDQCRTCHVYRTPPDPSGTGLTVSGHSFEPNFQACALCHGSAEVGQAKFAGLMVEFQDRERRVKAALDAWAARNPTFCNSVAHTGPCWEYTSQGGPNAAGQAKIPDDVKKARYLYYYVVEGGGNGVHNPDYVREAMIRAEQYAMDAPAALP